MGDRTATVIVEQHSLVREALASLIESHSHHVVCSVGSAGDLESGAFRESQPKLVILGSLPAECVAEAASSIRRCWQDVKIIMLFEKASLVDLQKLLASGLDACIPISASPRALIDALHLIDGAHLRILMVSGADVADAAKDGSRVEGRPRIASLSHSEMPGACDVLAKSSLAAAARGGRLAGLSSREEQILQALVRGQSNKMIARECTVTEATVKVHVKSILRKIQVGNRTQAAIWAMQSGYFADASEMMAKGLQAAPLMSGYN